MLDWSPGAIKGTVGSGGLGILMLSIASLDKPLHIGPGAAVTIALLPALIFVIFTEDDLFPAKLVRIAQWIAVGWYFLFAVISLGIAMHRGFTSIDAFFLCFVVLGAWPCLLAARRLRADGRELPGKAGILSSNSSEGEDVQHLASMPMGRDVMFTGSRKKALLLLLGSICFVALGVWSSSEKPWLGWTCVAFFGLGVPASLLMLLPGAMYLRLDAEGFELASLFRKHRTKWTEVAGFEIRTIRDTKMIAIVYRRADNGRDFGRAVALSLAGMEGAIPDSFNAPLNEIAASLNSWKSRFGRTEP